MRLVIGGLMLALGLLGCSGEPGQDAAGASDAADAATDGTTEPSTTALTAGHRAGEPLAGTRGALAELPYPEDAARVEVSTDRVVYVVPTAEGRLAALEAFYAATLTDHGWEVTGAEEQVGEEGDGTTEQQLALDVTGHERTARITMFDDGTDELAVLITLEA
jgi:hypothetical protein